LTRRNAAENPAARRFPLRGLQGVHRLPPVVEIAVLDPQGDRRAERLAKAYPRKNLDPVALDLHPLAAPVAALAAP